MKLDNDIKYTVVLKCVLKNIFIKVQIITLNIQT